MARQSIPACRVNGIDPSGREAALAYLAGRITSRAPASGLSRTRYDQRAPKL
jgi:hypothetical protein